MMKARALLTAIAVASALSLAACGSSGGGSAASGGSGSGNAPSGSASSASAASGGSASDSAPSGSAASGSSASGTASGGSAAGDSAASGSAASSGPTTTIGGGGLDAQSANWFNTACSGMSPLKDMKSTMTSLDFSKPKAAQQAMATMYGKMGDAFTSTASKLSSTPPPTFDKGSEMASKFVQAMGKAGPALKDAAGKISAADVSDSASLQQAMQDASSALSQSMQGLDLMGGYELDQKTQDAIEKLPACKALADTFGGS